MRIYIRTDASLMIGSGHVMRCLTLADTLCERGVEVLFICREHTGNLIGDIIDKGYQVICLQQAEGEYVAAPDDVFHAPWLGVSWEKDAADTIYALENGTKPQWLITDHYALDRRWEERLRPYACKIMVIDDLADRPHDCDLLLDQNLYLDMESRYHNLVSDNCQQLLGPKYALLRPEFVEARKNLRQRSGEIKRILVFFGGVDKTNETEKALEALSSITDRQFDVDVVVGGRNNNKESIQNFCATHDGFHYHLQVDNMAELMNAADLAIGAGGTTTWERCLLGLPTITIVVAENQLEAAIAVEKAGATWSLGWYKDVTQSNINECVNYAFDNPVALLKMSSNGHLLIGDIGCFDELSLINYLMG